MQLRIPGPTPVPPEVLQAGASPMVNHRGPEFADLITRVTARMKELMMTQNEVFVLTGSGTGALESAIVNTLSPGQKVLAVSIGEFGDRFTEIAHTFGANVIRMKFEPGEHADLNRIRETLVADRDIRALMITHNETSTGVTNDMRAVGALAKELDVLLLVDSVSGIGALPYPVDAWGGDVVATGSQKGWMAPPGLAMVAVSQRAMDAGKEAKMPRVYWDYAAAKSYLAKNQTPWTPALSVMYALDKGLELMVNEGLENVLARHARVGQTVRDAVKSIGMQLLPKDEKYASNSVTAIKMPEGVSSIDVQKAVREEFDIELAIGQGSLTPKLIRVGHLGWVSDKDIADVSTALKAVMPRFTKGA